MQCVSSVVVFCFESEMKLVIAEIVLSVKVAKMSKLELKTSVPAFKLDYRKRTVVCIYPSDFFKPERIFVKSFRSLEIGYVVIFVYRSEFHKSVLLVHYILYKKISQAHSAFCAGFVAVKRLI